MNCKIIIGIIMALVISLLACCSSIPIPVVTGVTVIPQASMGASQTNGISPSPEQPVSPLSTPSAINTTEDKWYDWDTVGAPPMSVHSIGTSVTSDGVNIYYPVRDYTKKTITLYKSSKDGTNKIKLDESVEKNKNNQGPPECYVNYCSGWLYYSIDGIIYRIKSDGIEKSIVMAGETPDYPIDNFIVVRNEIYIHDNVSGPYKYDFKGNITPIDGSIRALTEYDNGNVYYICTDGGG